MTKDFFSLQAHVQARGSAELLSVHELCKLAESCEPPPTDAGAWQWMQDVGKPLIRQLGQHLQRVDDRKQTNYDALIAAAVAMRKDQRERKKVSSELERKFDFHLSGASQMVLDF